MSRHLMIRSNNLMDSTKPFEKLSHWEYWKLRVQFWKWRLKRTGGRPVLMLWRVKS